ncbi:hypothetical protein VP01_36g4 [Puccinia sorghi]|uniref:Uncharacterized protein n=1 Tax=Puccinia sorghi TaxID=27349 RepID=A0A0L6UW34_9BASI|nr:hypothetical protein VP01_36g4 [Puccinia sorghi]
MEGGLVYMVFFLRPVSLSTGKFHVNPIVIAYSLCELNTNKPPGGSLRRCVALRATAREFGYFFQFGTTLTLQLPQSLAPQTGQPSGLHRFLKKKKLTQFCRMDTHQAFFEDPWIFSITNALKRLNNLNLPFDECVDVWIGNCLQVASGEEVFQLLAHLQEKKWRRSHCQGCKIIPTIKIQMRWIFTHGENRSGFDKEISFILIEIFFLFLMGLWNFKKNKSKSTLKLLNPYRRESDCRYKPLLRRAVPLSLFLHLFFIFFLSFSKQIHHFCLRLLSIGLCLCVPCLLFTNISCPKDAPQKSQETQSPITTLFFAGGMGAPGQYLKCLENNCTSILAKMCVCVELFSIASETHIQSTELGKKLLGQSQQVYILKICLFICGNNRGKSLIPKFILWSGPMVGHLNIWPNNAINHVSHRTCQNLFGIFTWKEEEKNLMYLSDFSACLVHHTLPKREKIDVGVYTDCSIFDTHLCSTIVSMFIHFVLLPLMEMFPGSYSPIVQLVHAQNHAHHHVTLTCHFTVTQLSHIMLIVKGQRRINDQQQGQKICRCIMISLYIDILIRHHETE